MRRREFIKRCGIAVATPAALSARPEPSPRIPGEVPMKSLNRMKALIQKQCVDTSTTSSFGHLTCDGEGWVTSWEIVNPSELYLDEYENSVKVTISI